MTRLKTMPIELLLEGRPAVCLGGCVEVASKVERLLAAGAMVTVVGETPLDPRITEVIAAGSVRFIERAPCAEDANDATIVFVSPEHEALGATLASQARARGGLVCTLDRPDAATFINPAVAEGPNLRVALSSGGRVPSLLRALREQLTRALSAPALVRFVDHVAEARANAPAGQRADTSRKLVSGFGVEVSWAFPPWFDARSEGESPPEGSADGPADDTPPA